MKKFICAAAAIAAGIMSVISLGGCKVGEAYVEYTLSESGDYYIVSGVSGDKLGLKSYEVPATYPEGDGNAKPVKEIGDRAFYQCYQLKNVTIPDTIEKIGRLAFAQCNFSEFVIPDSVTEIGGGAFGLCQSLTEITVPASVEKLGNMAFYCCPSLEKAYVKGSITVLEEKVFFNKVETQGGNVFSETSLTEVYLPASLEKIHASAFSGNMITDIYFAGTEEEWNNVYFFQMVKKEGKEDEYEEKRVEKSTAIKNVQMHFNAGF